MRLYFAHPVNVYNQPLEQEIVKLIKQRIHGVEVENPNQPHHQEGYKKWSARQKESDTKHKGMSYFYDEVLPACDGCIAMTFLDGRMGLGVAGEAKWFLERNKPVWLLVPFDKSHGCTPTGFTVRPLTDEEATALRQNDEKLVVQHEETRLRTWKVYNRERRPYEEAHLVSMPIPEGFYPEDSKK